MKTKFLSIIFLLVILSSLTFISSAQPTVAIPQASLGIVIEHPIADPIQIGQDHEFHFHLFNSTDGKPFLSNGSNIACSFHLYNLSGNHIFKQNNVSADDPYDWNMFVQGSNFSYSGQYAFVFQCNNSAIGGFYEHEFNVITTSQVEGSILDNPLFILLMFCALVLVITGIYYKVPALGFLGAILLILAGMYVLIYGLSSITNLYTRSTGIILISLGTFFLFLSAYEWISKDDED